MTERAKLHMKPEDPGPLPDPARGELKAKYSSIIEDGIASLNRALVLDPHYGDAMAYKSLLIRERADLRDTKEEYAADVAVADHWAQKNLESPRMSARGGSLTPIQVGSVLAGANLVRKVEAVYPPLAKEAHIQGIVRFTITIGKDGTVRKIQLVSAHPLLVEAALDALKQWVYMPTILNGEPVEVISPVNIQFTLTQ
jgi:TonB family protein